MRRRDLVGEGVGVRQAGLVALQQALVLLRQQRALLAGGGYLLQSPPDLASVHNKQASHSGTDKDVQGCERFPLKCVVCKQARHRQELQSRCASGPHPSSAWFKSSLQQV